MELSLRGKKFELVTSLFDGIENDAQPAKLPLEDETELNLEDMAKLNTSVKNIPDSILNSL